MKYIIVQAGGKGTRLGHLTKNKPKALVPIQNLPILFHLFRQYPDKRYIIIADYKKEVLREYLSCFAEVKYQVVEANGTGTCSGIRKALKLVPDKEAFMLIWSDLILPSDLKLPEEYQENIGDEDKKPQNDYIGISEDFLCRWSYRDNRFFEESSRKDGVAGLFLFTDKEKLDQIPINGELVRWLEQEKLYFRTISLAGTREFGILMEYEKLVLEKCRPFNCITVKGDVLVKKAIDKQGEKLAIREQAWYKKAKEKRFAFLPQIYSINPLTMEFVNGKNIYEYNLSYVEKENILSRLVNALQKLHELECVPSDSFSMKEAYYNKTMARLHKIEDLVPFAREKEIIINGKTCRNIFFHKRELEQKLEHLKCDHFCFIHGDCTFSNLILQDDKSPILIDPRGYFGFTEFYGDERYDWAKLYYSIVGNYDSFNLKKFQLDIEEKKVHLRIESNHWEDMEDRFFEMTKVAPEEIKLLHAVIWLSLTTYAWQDYDSICGAFYNGLYYLEDVL